MHKSQNLPKVFVSTAYEDLANVCVQGAIEGLVGNGYVGVPLPLTQTLTDPAGKGGRRRC